MIQRTLLSKEDLSANFILNHNFETRFVRREKNYFIIYLSSHSGCNKSCRFCHLTQTKQTSFEPATLNNYLEQANTVYKHYQNVKDKQGMANKVNYNFMARGEALANPTILNNADILFSHLEQIIAKDNIQAQFNISTIMPSEILNLELSDIFKNVTQNHMIYYSLYSVNPSFRKRWLPKAIDPLSALQKLKRWQDSTGKLLTFHWAFIDGQNDSIDDIEQILELIQPFNFQAKFNLVRYNPYSAAQSTESNEDILERNFNIISKALGHNESRIVPRVGFDVKASCGMFVDQQS